MAVLKHSSPSSRPLAGGAFDLGDLRAGAERALRDAREDAARIIAEAKEEARILRETAQAEGFAEGRAIGLAEGESVGRAQGEEAGKLEALAVHDSAFKALEEAYAAEFLRWSAQRDEIIRTSESELAAVAVAIAESIVREHISQNPAWIARAVESAVQLFARATRVTVEIAPEDESLIAEAMPTLRSALPADAEIALVARDGIARGGCVIRSSEGTLDARIETQFRRMREGIVGGALPEALP